MTPATEQSRRQLQAVPQELRSEWAVRWRRTGTCSLQTGRMEFDSRDEADRAANLLLECDRIEAQHRIGEASHISQLVLEHRAGSEWEDARVLLDQRRLWVCWRQHGHPLVVEQLCDPESDAWHIAFALEHTENLARWARSSFFSWLAIEYRSIDPDLCERTVIFDGPPDWLRTA